MALHASPVAIKELQELLHFTYDSLLSKVRIQTTNAVGIHFLMLTVPHATTPTTLCVALRA